MTVNPESAFTIVAFVRARILCSWGTKLNIHVDFGLMHVTSLVLLQMSFSAERDGAIDASEGSLEIVDVGVKTKLMSFREALVTVDANVFPVLVVFIQRVHMTWNRLHVFRMDIQEIPGFFIWRRRLS